MDDTAPTKPVRKTVISSLSLSKEDWIYLRSLAHELLAKDAKTADTAIEFKRASVSDAVRHLIREDLARRKKDKNGQAVFKAGHEQVRLFNVSTGTTATQSEFEPEELYTRRKDRR